MKNKLQKTYENIFNKIKENIKIYSNNTSYKPQEFLCDLEISISNSINVIFPLIKIRNCLWHIGRALEANRKKYIKDEDNSYILYKCIINLEYIDPNYVIPIFNYIKDFNQNPSFKKILEYFENNYLKICPLKNLNYFDCIENTANNCCESYNNKLNNFFF